MATNVSSIIEAIRPLIGEKGDRFTDAQIAAQLSAGLPEASEALAHRFASILRRVKLMEVSGGEVALPSDCHALRVETVLQGGVELKLNSRGNPAASEYSILGNSIITPADGSVIVTYISTHPELVPSLGRVVASRTNSVMVSLPNPKALDDFTPSEELPLELRATMDGSDFKSVRVFAKRLDPYATELELDCDVPVGSWLCDPSGSCFFLGDSISLAFLKEKAVFNLRKALGTADVATELSIVGDRKDDIKHTWIGRQGNSQVVLNNPRYQKTL